MSFDNHKARWWTATSGLNPFGTGQCLSTKSRSDTKKHHYVSIPLEQGNVFRRSYEQIVGVGQSQSLWNRAMSFDFHQYINNFLNESSQSLWNRAMSFDVELVEGRIALAEGLNPFGTGQCLSTKKENKLLLKELVSIPLEQGNVFRLQWGVRALCGKASQSHFPTFSDVWIIGY